nr:TetR/AcrR family transcriptional regulator [Pollutimonas bauzanensis]
MVIIFIGFDRMEAKLTRKEASHRRIVEAAARAIRRGGYGGVGVADIMKEAGLTHGGFYAHFPSRDAMLAEALEYAGQDASEAAARRADQLRRKGASPFRALVETYLSDAHCKSLEAGCPVAALVSDMPRQSPQLREASSHRVRDLLGAVQRALPAAVAPGESAVIASTLVGALQLARALGEGEQRQALLAANRAALISQYDIPGDAIATQ